MHQKDHPGLLVGNKDCKGKTGSGIVDEEIIAKAQAKPRQEEMMAEAGESLAQA